MLQPSDFNKPTEHPWPMLEGLGLKHTYEAESMLAWMLERCIEAGKFTTIRTKHEHPALVSAGLLIKDADGYKLTTKAIGLLYSYYGKGEA